MPANVALRSIDALFANMPRVHCGETEMNGPVPLERSRLRAAELAPLLSRQPVCWAIDRQLADFIAQTMNEKKQSLETGAGLSTLVFALSGATHWAVTPAPNEVELLTEYARRHDVPLGRTTFINEPSESYLPRCDLSNLDCVLIDGKHAFPWPVVDWFYTADRLRLGGTLILDDIRLPAVSVLAEFLSADHGWRTLLRTTKAMAFEKAVESVHQTAWHLQAWTPRTAAFDPNTEFRT